jgi:hypothetical protein
MAAYEFADTEKVEAVLHPTDAKGQPASLDGAPAWESSDPSIVSVASAPDGLSASCIAGVVGAARVTVTADVLFGPEVKNLVDFIDFTVIAGEAVGLGVTLGTPQPQ